MQFHYYISLQTLKPAGRKKLCTGAQLVISVKGPVDIDGKRGEQYGSKNRSAFDTKRKRAKNKREEGREGGSVLARCS